VKDTSVENTIGDLIEHMFEEWEIQEASNGKPLTRFQIGSLLKDFDMNTPENIRMMVKGLLERGAKVL